MTGRIRGILVVLGAVLIGTVLLSCDSGKKIFTKDLADLVEDKREEIGFPAGEDRANGKKAYTFTAEEKAALAAALKQDLDDRIYELEEEGLFLKIVYTEDFSILTAYVDPSTFHTLYGMEVVPFLKTAAALRILNGEDPDRVDVTLRFWDANAEEVQKPQTYQHLYRE